MAMTKLATFALAVLMASITAAVAEVNRDCLRELREMGITPPAAQAKRMCDPKNKVKPNEYGWVCEGMGAKFSKVKGQGARLKRDAICE
jgi:hypothetical protein